MGHKDPTEDWDEGTFEYLGDDLDNEENQRLLGPEALPPNPRHRTRQAIEIAAELRALRNHVEDFPFDM